MAMLGLVRDGAVAVVTFNRPPANAITRDFFREVEQLLPELAAPAVRAVVITGSGRFFSAGLDLFEVFAYGSADFSDFTTRFDAGFLGLFALQKPVVAAMNGHAVAGGAVLAAIADFRVMADGDGRVGLTEIQVGLPFPVSVLEIVRYACAGPHLTELLCRGLTYPPRAACTRQLVDEVLPASDLLPRSLSLARELAALTPAAFAATKRALRGETLARLRAVPPGTDPVWDQWRAPETRAAVDAYRARTLSAKSRGTS
jgi:enoyl-CoA hydratase